MESTTPQRFFLQKFPKEGHSDRTNKFAVSFQDDGHLSITDLTKIFKSKFQPIYNLPNSFQIWKQQFESGRILSFIMVDMDKIKAQNKTLVNVANDLMDIISNQNGFTLRQNNRDHYMGIALPCGCDQENSPFPTLQLIPGTPEYIPIPGKWHDPNKCSKLASAPVIIANGSNNMVPTAQAPTAMSIPAFTLPDGTVPEGNVSYPLYFNYAPPPGAEYNAMDQFPMDPSASMGGGMMENNGFSYPLMNWLAEDDQNQFQPGVQQGGSNHGQ